MSGPAKTVLITGGSSGIGLELSRLFARDQYRLVIVSKPKTELEQGRVALLAQFPKTDIITIPMDLTAPEAPAKVYAFMKDRNIAINVLVNCAGFGTFGFINDISIEQELKMINLHVGTLYHLSRLFLKDMVDRNNGHIVNISSVSAFQANPRLATYGATKSFVLQFSRAINFELREKGLQVSVTAVCPTPTRNTAFQKEAGMERSNTFDGWLTVTPDIVARDAYRGMLKRKDLVIPGRGFNLLRKILRHFPESWMIRYSGSNLKEKH